MKRIKKLICFCVIQIVVLSYINAQFNAPEKGILFQDSIVPRIDIVISESALDFILHPQNAGSDQLQSATFYFTAGEFRDTVGNVGFRLRGNTSRSADKKSFKVDFNSFQGGRKFQGIEKLNLNGQHNDPTMSRAKICSDIASWMEIPTLRSNHVELYINNEYFGLYTNTEQIDDEYVQKRFGNDNGNLYKCLFPADLVHLGSDPDVYKQEVFGSRNYQLKTNTEEDDYSDFAELVDVLNNSSPSNRACKLEEVFNVDQYLKYIVFDILTGNWDGPLYNKNNFYLYHNTKTD